MVYSVVVVSIELGARTFSILLDKNFEQYILVVLSIETGGN